MAIHNRRKDEDTQSYQLLLRDYIGVDDTGKRLDHSKNCLRVVLLGYLKPMKLSREGAVEGAAFAVLIMCSSKTWISERRCD